MRNKSYYIYILASKTGTLYLGATNNLVRRVYEHKNKFADGFSKKYDCNKLIYFEQYYSIELAIKREKQIKNWRRNKKEFLIKKFNPTWRDLYFDLIG